MAIITWEKDGCTAVVTMNNGANRQNLAFAETMNLTFDEILEDDTVNAMVLTSSDPKNFSQGIDVEWLGTCFANQAFDDIKSFMYAMNRVFSRLLLMPIPTIAAINGHAFGNGAILSCACDFRFMKKDRGFFCFPEVDLNIPFLPGMIAFVRKAIPEHMFNDMTLTGRRVTADELALHHIIRKASPDQESLMQEVLTFAGGFQKQRPIFGEHKKRFHKSIVEIMENEDPEFIDALRLIMN